MIFGIESPPISLRSLEDYTFEFFIYLHRIVNYFCQILLEYFGIDASDNTTEITNMSGVVFYLLIDNIRNKSIVGRLIKSLFIDLAVFFRTSLSYK